MAKVSIVMFENVDLAISRSFLIITPQDMLHYITKYPAKYLQLLKLNMANYSIIDCSGKGKSSATMNVSFLWCSLDGLNTL